MEEKEYSLVDIKKFNKINKRQKKNIILKALSSFVFLESSIAFTVASIAALNSTLPAEVSPLLLAESGLTLMMCSISLQSLSNENKKNNKLIKKLGE